MLDIGGGTGLFSFYAACMGANEVVCLEPEVEGSSSGVLEKFKKLQLGLKDKYQVKLVSTELQNFDPNDKKFDIILLHNSINHLDEKACTNLKYDSQAIETYRMIFQKLSYLASNGSKLIITDCSRYNFFALCGLKNPFAHSIEWHKHQSPKYWAKLLSDVGFRNPKVRWSSPNQLRSIGRLVVGNKIASYFLQSHFCLTMEKSY
jgi:SAM-dependent methyltransferase